MPRYNQVDEAPDSKPDWQLLRRLLGYLRPYHWLADIAVVSNLLVAALLAVRPWLTKIAIDRYIIPRDSEGLGKICLLILGLMLLQAALQYVLTYTMAYIGQNIIHDLRRKLYRRAMRQDLRYFDKTPVGQVVSRVTSDIDALNEMFSSGIIMVISDILVIVFILAFMFSLNWRLALISLTILPPLLLTSFLFRIKARPAFRAVRKNVGRLNGFMQEHLNGMGLVQLFGREEVEAQKFAAINRDLQGAHVRTVFYYSLYFPAVEFMSSVTIGLVVWYGGAREVQGQFSLGELIMFVQYVQMFFRPVYDLSDKYNVLQNAMAASERIFDLMDQEPGLTEIESPEALGTVAGMVDFDRVWFAYDDDDFVLKEFSLHIEPGETVAVVGATGAGKTTLISLLNRFYDVQRGSVRLDGKELQELSLHELRSHIAIVLQDVHLVAGSIHDNITLSNPEISRETVIQASEMVGADPFIRDLTDGYDSVLQERGAPLSVGQKQLLAFARALVYDPSILILDEATSSVDTETEVLIQKATAAALADRTAIVIAHRLSTIRHADRIAVLHKGELRELGTHAQLLEQGGIYARLYQLQYKDQLAADGGNPELDLDGSQPVTG